MSREDLVAYARANSAGDVSSESSRLASSTPSYNQSLFSELAGRANLKELREVQDSISISEDLALREQLLRKKALASRKNSISDLFGNDGFFSITEGREGGRDLAGSYPKSRQGKKAGTLTLHGTPRTTLQRIFPKKIRMMGWTLRRRKEHRAFPL